MSQLLYEEDTFQIIGKCMSVHTYLGKGFLEIVYKDALEYEFKKAGIFYEREKRYEVNYKGQLLPHHFYADFVVENKIILEAKAMTGLSESHYAQTINYLKVSNCRVGLLINFGEDSLRHKRFIL